MQHKQLPPNPSLEYLKSQAKQLKAYKEGSPDALQRIRSFFPNVARRLQAHIEKSDATDVEIQNAAFGLQDAQLVIAREYGFASWTQLKAEVLHREQKAEEMPTEGVLFQILRTPDHTQADIQRVEAAGALDECLEVVEALLEAGADVHRRYGVDMDGEVLELTPLTYTQKLASLFPDKPFDRIIKVLRTVDTI